MRRHSLIHLFLVGCATMLLVFSTTTAQTDYSNRGATTGLSIGLGFSGGATMHTDAFPGQKIGPAFAFRTGLDITYPLKPTIGVMLGLGIENRGTKSRPEDTKEVYTITNISYFSITPGFQFSSFYLGVRFGLPLGGSITFKPGANFDETTEDMTSTDEDRLEVAIEPLIGFVIPLVDEKVGWLGLTLAGGYGVTETITKSEQHMVSLLMGLTWQFAIPGTGRN